VPDSVTTTSPKKSNLLLIVGIVCALVAAGVLSWWLLSSGSETQAGPVASTLALDTFVVNLAGEQRAYLRVGVTLGLSRPLSKKQQENFPVALVRDTIVGVLTSTSPQVLLKSDGKKQLKTNLLDALKARTPELGVEDVYFTEFLVQM
jgi:flagellar basal body-associated protein FliL